MVPHDRNDRALSKAPLQVRVGLAARGASSAVLASYGFLPGRSGWLEPRASGGIGRRARFRSVCPKGCGGSTPPSRTHVMSRDIVHTCLG